MFNHADYEKRLAEMISEVGRDFFRSGVPPEWCDTVDLRYARFLIGNVRNRLTRVDSGMEFSGTMPKDYLPHLANEVRDVAGILYNAAMLISGTVKVADPVRCEAEMRLFEEANRPPPLIEPDMAFRLRVIEATEHASTLDRQLAQTLTGADLDGLAIRFVLKRGGTAP